MKRVFIDLDICDKCDIECDAKCSYYYHPFNDGVMRLSAAVADAGNIRIELSEN